MSWTHTPHHYCEPVLKSCSYGWFKSYFNETPDCELFRIFWYKTMAHDATDLRTLSILRRVGNFTLMELQTIFWCHFWGGGVALTWTSQPTGTRFYCLLALEDNWPHICMHARFPCKYSLDFCIAIWALLESPNTSRLLLGFTYNWICSRFLQWQLLPQLQSVHWHPEQGGRKQSNIREPDG